jgi:hypothetical protein
VLVGNVGELIGHVELFDEARPDDGMLGRVSICLPASLCRPRRIRETGRRRFSS